MTITRGFGTFPELGGGTTYIYPELEAVMEEGELVATLEADNELVAVLQEGALVAILEDDADLEATMEEGEL